MDVAALQAAIANAVGSSIQGIQTHPGVPDSIVAPAFSAGEPDPIEYDETFGGLVQILFKSRLYAARVDAQAGQAALNGYLGPTGPLSIKAAIQKDRSLGGLSRTLQVERAHGYGAYKVGAEDYYGVQFDVRVWAL